MKEKTKLVITLLSILIAAELVLIASLLINSRSPRRPTLVPTIALNGAEGVELAEAPEPSEVIEDDLWERQTGEAMLEQGDYFPEEEVYEGDYPPPDFTPYADPDGAEYLPPPMDSWSPDEYIEDSYPTPGDSWGDSSGWEDYSDWDDLPDWNDYYAPPPTDIPADPTPVPPTATLETTATLEVTLAPTAAATETVPAPPTATEPAAAPTATPTVEEPDQAPTPPAAQARLAAARVEAGPALDGAADDPAWQQAAETVIETQGGANDSAAQVTVKAVYDDDSIYFLLTWEDPGPSFLNRPWEKQADGSWTQLVGPGPLDDESVFAEDKIALLWPTVDQPDFTALGCGVACHAGENPESKAYGNMYMPAPGQIGDLWVWKSVRSLGQADDLYLDGTRYSGDTPAAGRSGDPRTGGGYTANEQDGRPAYMPPGGGDRTGAPGYILDGEKVELDDSLFEAGQRLPGFIIAAFEGDRGDISAGWRYDGGRWTLELGRRLVTGSNFDVQFSDLSRDYAFGLATFDNTQLRHAYQSGAVLLNFTAP